MLRTHRTHREAVIAVVVVYVVSPIIVEVQSPSVVRVALVKGTRPIVASASVVVYAAIVSVARTKKKQSTTRPLPID